MKVYDLEDRLLEYSVEIIRLAERLPKDRSRLLTELDALLASGSLDNESPGTPPLSL